MNSNDKGISTLQIILIVATAMAVVLGLLLFFWHSHRGAEQSAGGATILSEDQKAYLPQLEFTDAHMSAAENFLGDSVTYLDARVINKGTKTVRRLDVDLTFVDTLNQVVLRERAHPVSPHTQPLQAGEAKAFRMSFEHMPAEWNQAVPGMVPVYVEF
jgi:hypothetical protein